MQKVSDLDSKHDKLSESDHHNTSCILWFQNNSGPTFIDYLLSTNNLARVLPMLKSVKRDGDMSRLAVKLPNRGHFLLCTLFTSYSLELCKAVALSK